LEEGEIYFNSSSPLTDEETGSTFHVIEGEALVFAFIDTHVFISLTVI
jgi:hypothetical protein